MVGPSQQHEQAQAQLEQEQPLHYSVDAPAAAQGKEVEVVEMWSDIGDAWREGCGLIRGHSHSGHNYPHFSTQNQSSH